MAVRPIAGAGPLIGRDQELASILALLKQVQAASACAAVIRGDGGVGKSRLLSEVLDRAEGQGCTIVVGRTGDFDRGIPYATLRDGIERLNIDDGETSAFVDDLKSALDLDATGDSQATSHDSGPRRRVYEASLRLFRALAGAHPTILALEDLHVADGDSVALVGLLMRHVTNVPFMVVATERPASGAGAGELSVLVDQLIEEGRGLAVDLEPLDAPETRAVILAHVGAHPDSRTVDTVYAQSGGNPLLIQVVLLALRDSGALVVDGTGCRLVGEEPQMSASRRATLLHRVFRGTPSAALSVARVVAAFGRFHLDDLPVVSELLGLTTDETGGSFDALVTSGLVVHSPDDSFGFSHPIVRDTIYDDIGPAERRRIHGAIADRLRKSSGTGSARDLLELATHLAESASPGDQAAIEIIAQAARVVRTRAPRVAADWYGRALELLPERGELRGDLLARQARVLWMAAHPAEAADAGRRALELVGTDASSRTGTVAVVANALYSMGAVQEALGFIEKEPSLAGNACPLPALRANLLGQAGRIQEAHRASIQALQCLDGPVAAQAIAIGHLTHLAHLLGDLTSVGKLLARLEELIPDASTATVLAIREFSAFLRVGDGFIHKAEEDLDTVGHLLEASDSLDLGGQAVATRVRNRWLLGHWDEALEMARSAGLNLEHARMTITLPYLRAVEAAILVNRGRADQARRFIDLGSAGMALKPMAAWARALVHRALGQLKEAIAELEKGAALFEDGVVIFADLVRSLLAEIYLDMGDPTKAKRVASDLAGLAASSRHPWSRHLSLRTTALVGGDADAAVEAIQVADREGIVFGAGRSHLLLGSIMSTGGAEHLQRAYEVFERLQADPWQRSTARFMRDRGIPVPRSSSRSAGLLSEAEGKIARLVQEGLTNRQIASTLHYSVKTIEVYLTRIYEKTGCASRFELARALDAGRLVIEQPEQ